MEFSHIIEWLRAEGFGLFDPTKRFFWGNILGALILLVLIPGSNKKERWKTLFSKRIWFHASSKADMKIIVINFFFRSFLLPTSFLTSFGVAAFISLMLTYLFGGKPSFDIHPTLSSLAFTITIFLASDFSAFYLHYLQHRWQTFWVFHQTHHSALVLTPLTLLRTHPFEIVTGRFQTALTYGLVIGFFFYAIGETVTGWDILGTEVIGFTFNFLGANLRHSEVWVHFGRLEWLFISPAAHQVHHSSEDVHYDKNFGVCLTIWDKLFGTYYDPRQVTHKLSYGLVDSPLSAPEQKLWTLYIQPFKDLARVYRKSP